MRLMASEIAVLTGIPEREVARKIDAGELGPVKLVNGEWAVEHGTVTRKLKREFTGSQLYEAIRDRGVAA